MVVEFNEYGASVEEKDKFKAEDFDINNMNI